MGAQDKDIRVKSSDIEDIHSMLKYILDEVRAHGVEKFDCLQFCKKLSKFRLLRAKFFPNELFGEPAWDMLVDLYIAHREGRHISVTSAGIASGAPATTALRWVGLLEEMGFIARYGSALDKRIKYVRLTDEGLRRMNDYFASVDRFEHANIDSYSEFVVEL